MSSVESKKEAVSGNVGSDPVVLREQAARCRRLSNSALDKRTLDALASMADEYEREAARLTPPG